MEADNIAGARTQRLPVWACIPLFIVILFILLGLYGTLARGCLSLVLGVEARHPGVMGYNILEASMLLAVLTAAIPMLRFERRPFSDFGALLKRTRQGTVVWLPDGNPALSVRFRNFVRLGRDRSHRFPVQAVGSAGLVGVFPAGRLVRRNTDARLYPRTPIAYHHE